MDPSAANEEDAVANVPCSSVESNTEVLAPGERHLNRRGLASYGLGHFYNDLCASLWFTYLLIFLQKVLNFSSIHAGFLMLVGQVTDAVCTPLVGLASDKATLLPSWLQRIGRRKAWHLLELSSSSSQRTSMNGLRYAGVVVGNLTVFLLVSFYLSMDRGGTNTISPADFRYFRDIDLIVVCLGCFVCALFHFTTKEPKMFRRYTHRSTSIESDSGIARMGWYDWLRNPQFYQIALLYMLSRLYTNISQVYLPFYIQFTQQFPKEYLGYFPIIVYVSSFTISFVASVPFVTKLVNKKILYGAGIATGLGACIWMWFLPMHSSSQDELHDEEMVVILVLIGFAQALVLVNSLTESCAFVYGAMSFVDKLANGAVIQVIEIINPSCHVSLGHRAPVCQHFYRRVMSLVPGVCLVGAFLLLLCLLPQRIGQRTKVDQRRTNERSVDEDDVTPIWEDAFGETDQN